MAEKKTTKKAAVKETAEVKKAPARRACGAKKAAAALVLTAENVGFKALAANGEALTVKEIAKQAKITEEETLIGMGWLFKEGKIVATDDKVSLA